MKLTLRNSIEKRDGAGRFDITSDASPLHVIVLGTREEAEAVVAAVNERAEMRAVLELCARQLWPAGWPNDGKGEIPPPADHPAGRAYALLKGQR